MGHSTGLDWSRRPKLSHNRFAYPPPVFHPATLKGMNGCNGIVLPRMIVSALPPLAAVANPVSVVAFLGDARTLSFPEVSACLLLGWLIVLTLPNVHRVTERTRQRSLTASFALAMQALFFAPHVAPFLYFQF
jgi:alginate O-acetyltransferase complex protein AlgI